MRKTSVTLLVTILAASCFATLIGQTFAQSIDPPKSPMPSPPLTIRWMRYQGAITQWGSDPYRGSITVNAKTANAPPAVFKPWVTVGAFWSNQPHLPGSKPTGQGQYTFTCYDARLVRLTSIRKQEDMIVNITGLWNVNKVKVTTLFDQSGAPVNTVREVTPIVTQAAGQLHITTDWKKFTVEIEGVNALEGVEISMMTTTNIINPFSYSGAPQANVNDLEHVMGCFRAIAGLGNFNPELDYNKNSKIDLGDLTTVAANM
ncbi:MAG: hypothetical protein NWE98_11550 [Candidatus Bathyarchaeota archaeon]|nr:hypothetical protein [Candidatus Bathyarchaeota archaeon]